MELKVENVQLPDRISFNYEELKGEIMAKANDYAMMVYSEDQIKTVKEDRAKLNSLKKALNDERIRREKEYMEPFNQFKAQIAEIISIIDKPVGIIDEQVKAYEQKKADEKRQALFDFFAEQERPDWLAFPQIENPKWRNASFTLKNAEAEILETLGRIKNDLETLNTLDAFSFEAIETYKSTLDLSKAISEGKRLADLQKRKEEAEARKKAEEEARAEAKRIADEAQEKLCEQFLNQQESPAPVSEPKKEEPQKVWIAFKALMDPRQASELKTWCDQHGVEIKPYNE